MSLTWTQSPDGGMTAPHGRGIVRVSPLGRDAARWFAFGIDGKVIPFGEQVGSWPSLAEAQAACEASQVRRKPGRKPRGAVECKLRLTPEAIALLDCFTRRRARELGRPISRAEAAQELLMALPGKKP